MKPYINNLIKKQNMSTSITSRRPNATKDSVKHAAALLFVKTGVVTTLDVKKELRDHGFWAEQQAVSTFMQELAAEENWKSKTNGKFNEYSLPVGAAFDDPANFTPVTTRIIDLIKDQITADEVLPSNTMESDLGMDDLEVVQAITTIEQEYAIQFAPGEHENFSTVHDLITRAQQLIDVKNGTSTATPVASPLQTNSSIQTPAKTKKKAATVINDSTNPSASGKVKVNLDPKNHLLSGIDNTTASILTTQDKMDWVCSHSNGRDRKIYDQKYTSDNVRTAYCRLVKMKIQDVRACRVKHLK